MTVNAIAKYLQKKVLLVDFSALLGRGGFDSQSATEIDLRGLFREASMNNALIFFDECENIFRARSLGNDRMLNTMLTEIERHSGIVFLATNLAYELDEAMHRRITCIIEYRLPDATMRKQIWMNLLSSSSANDDTSSRYRLAEDVDLDVIAMKYELTGGFIKNAVLSALLCSLHRDEAHPILYQSDLISGCNLQMRGSMIQRSFEDKVHPKLGLEQLNLNSEIKQACQRILSYEHARAVLYALSSSSSSIEQRACIVSFLGPSGSGKRTLACALAYDLHRNIKYLHVADILSSNVTETLKSVRILLQDARLSDSIFILDGCEHLLDDPSSMDSSSNIKLSLVLSRLLDLVEQYPGLVILLAHIDGPQHISLHRELASRLFECIRFVFPTIEIRSKIWNSLLPKNLILDAGKLIR
jgi:SpoVK/Ycf46/Vps4 family AAA+-type ATPase